ncbi:MAG: tetratricopeptide repeat-containing sulfotransferase family protein [Alphaproteobacteria bacterium]
MSAEVQGTVAEALAHATRLLSVNPAQAEAQSREVLNAVPDHPHALLLLGMALRRKGDAVEARKVLEPLAAAQPRSASAHLEFGLCLAQLGESDGAISAFERAVKINPNAPEAWQALGDQLTLAGDGERADRAYAQHIRTSVRDPKLLAAAAALCDNRLAVAERLLREFLKAHPTDVTAIRMLGEVGTRLGRYEDAEKLLSRCLELAPSFTTARHNYAIVLYRQNKSAEAIQQVDKLLAQDPHNPGYRNLKAAALARIGEYARAAETYASVLRTMPNLPKVWMSYGHTLKTMGKRAESIAAYRKSVQLLPNLGEAYWSLANLKTFRFTPADVQAMRKQLERQDISDEDRFHLHFALGKALEDENDYAQSFDHYAKANALRRAGVQYDAHETAWHVQRSKALFTAEFFRTRSGWGNTAPDPIFVVGLPRSGSTLIEQILASHSQVEGTMELPDVISIVRRLGGKKRKSEQATYPESLRNMKADNFENIGAEYLERTRIQRKLGRPFFIDKTPQNFLHLGLIHLMLPNSKVIDVRRYPLGCCFSCFKQHFARGHHFTYELTELGQYYADYIDLMTHFDSVLPRPVHRVLYESLVEKPEEEIRRLLEYCGLPFEEQCLRFYETERAIRTASSEQVRMPIFTESVDHWRNYEPWLGPLKEALGDVLNSYSAAQKI